MKPVKTLATLFVLTLALLACIEVKAAMHKENLPMEGELDERSVLMYSYRENLKQALTSALNP